MSRGLGPLQKAILRELASYDDRYTLEITRYACAVPVRPDGYRHRVDITEAQHSATRRALLALERRGLVFRQPGRSPQGEVIWMDRKHARAYVRRVLETLGAGVLAKHPRLLELARGKRDPEPPDWFDPDLPLPL